MPAERPEPLERTAFLKTRMWKESGGSVSSSVIHSPQARSTFSP